MSHGALLKAYNAGIYGTGYPPLVWPASQLLLLVKGNVDNKNDREQPGNLSFGSIFIYISFSVRCCWPGVK
jgi:hypothetical protein